MLKGELGNQARELDGLITWLKSTARPDVICLSNALLVGMVRRLKSELNVPLVCMLQGEDGFLDSLPAAHREECWRTLAERARECDKFIATSEYFANLMGARLGIGADRMALAHNGINLQGYAAVPEKGAERAQNFRRAGDWLFCANVQGERAGHIGGCIYRATKKWASWRGDVESRRQLRAGG